MQLILASASPRRQELLRNARIPFSVQPADIHEQYVPGEAPESCVRRLARKKAQAIAARVGVASPILAADTEVFLNAETGTPLGKPADPDAALRMLQSLSGGNHYVITGVCLLWRGAEGKIRSQDAAEVTMVHMERVAEEELRSYIATGDPFDKAGGYGIQGFASRWISRIEGCYFNVVGLPVPLVTRMLREHLPELVATGP